MPARGSKVEGRELMRVSFERGLWGRTQQQGHCRRLAGVGSGHQGQPAIHVGGQGCLGGSVDNFLHDSHMAPLRRQVQAVGAWRVVGRRRSCCGLHVLEAVAPCHPAMRSRQHKEPAPLLLLTAPES